MVVHRMTNPYDFAAYVAAGVSFAAAAVEPTGLQLANEIVTLVGGIIGAVAGAVSLAYFIYNWRKKK